MVTDALIGALATIFTPANIPILVIGTVLGFIIGMIPGMGGTITLALLIPLTFGMQPATAFILLAAAHGGVNQGGAISSILLNTPGSAPNAATLLDGFPMARKGEGGRAISAAAVASAAGAILGLAVLVVSIPILIEVVLAFGPPEIFWLGIWGIAALAFIIGDDLKKGVIAGGLGIMFALHGQPPIAPGYRFSFGFTQLQNGFNVVAAVIGLFAIAEMINLVSKGQTIAEEDQYDAKHGRLQGFKDVFVHKWLFLRSAIIGVLVGVIPGIGGVTANYIAYMQAVLTSKNNETFGEGDVRGVIASEASNDAKSGGAYIPTLGFGVPGSASMAVLFGAFLLHGIQPGPRLLQQNLDIVTIIIVAALFSNILSSTLAIALSDRLTAVTRIDINLLAPGIIGISFIAAFALNNDIFDVYTALLFGIMGYMMIRANMPRIPLIIGMILGPIIESNFFRSMQISSWEVSIFWSSTISIILILLVVLTMLGPFIQRYVSFASLDRFGGGS
ncbi:tripartite tricarboxylate transporter permease [Halovenus marina]|uniref:tripartite tricarboxylate transporter permease n=1 Tax=Halovenus marina TaxID=3396621 RepID=UPI003F546903